jgi:hypothetical protein
VLFTVDVRPTSGADRSQAMRVGEVADVLLGYGAPQIVGGHAASVQVTAPGTTTITYFAADAAGNDEAARTVTVRIGP